jgi:4-amino-4-deoxy-L-arabinose transferase-like glycosyltransferase
MPMSSPSQSVQSPPVPPFRADRTEWLYRFGLFLLLLLIFVPFYGAFGLWDPWETHYGEVGRSMMEREDWISTWWGSHWRDGNGGSEGEYFLSKPVLLMWMMGIGMQLFGVNAWGVRAGVGIVVIVGTMMIYIMGREVFSRRSGMLMALVTATSPFWAMLGRQSQTDMPYVGLMTAGLCFFLMGAFGRRRHETATRFDIGLFIVTWLALFIPQMQLIWVKFNGLRFDFGDEPTLVTVLRGVFMNGAVLVGLYSVLALLVLVSLLRGKPKTKGQIWFLAFYVFIALATLAKGLLGFLLPGAIILLYLIVSGHWRLLAEVQLVRGITVFVTIAFPWYVAMFTRHHPEFFNRFIVHDHLRRLSSGVHQTDNGSFEHFIKWLGYGLFPWGSFVPAALARVSVGRDVGNRTDTQRARLFLVLWFVIAFTLFTLSSTKFHHYIFPCVPALSMLVGLFLQDLLSKKVRAFWPLYITAIGLFAMVGFDLFMEPQNLKNLFTYQYDRMWHESMTEGFQSALRVMFVIGLAGFLLFAIRKQAARIAALVVTMVTATSITVWSLDVYMPNIAQDWSQSYLWDTYYRLCTPIDGPEGAPEWKPFCREPVISYKLNWRGETFYTHNEVIPLEDDADFEFFIRTNEDRSFFAIMQRGRLGSFRAGLPESLRPGVSEVHTENLKFILVRVLNAEDRAAIGFVAPADERQYDDDE